MIAEIIPIPTQPTIPTTCPRCDARLLVQIKDSARMVKRCLLCGFVGIYPHRAAIEREEARRCEARRDAQAWAPKRGRPCKRLEVAA